MMDEIRYILRKLSKRASDMSAQDAITLQEIKKLKDHVKMVETSYRIARALKIVE